ncbi:MAG: MOSC domain-containing protein [Pseudomonadota bacterium]
MLAATALLGVYVGRPSKLPDGRRSSIVKQRVQGPLQLSLTGLTGDKVADARIHGGPEMALHHFPAEHFAGWAAQFPEIADALVPGSIGENLSAFGLTEENVHIGDVFRWGEAEIEVNQPRMPCIKINSRYAVEGLAEAIMQAGRCGWYLRVLRPGEVQSDQPLQHLARPAGSISLAAFWAVQNAHRPGIAQLQQVAEAPALADKWRRKFRQRIEWLQRNGG